MHKKIDIYMQCYIPARQILGCQVDRTLIGSWFCDKILLMKTCFSPFFSSFLALLVASLQLVKLCSGMIEAGKAYVSANKLFVSGIRDLSQQCKKDEMISVSVSATSVLKSNYGCRCTGLCPDQLYQCCTTGVEYFRSRE